MADCVNNVPWYTVWDAKTGDLLERAGAVEVLRTADEPDFGSGEEFHEKGVSSEERVARRRKGASSV